MTTLDPLVAPVTPLTVCTELLQLVESALVSCGSEPLNRVHVAAGAVAWDDCCGMLVVGPERIYRSMSFPAEAPEETSCWSGLIALDVVVLLVRCVPVVDNRGHPPTVPVLDAAYGGFLADAAIVWNALASPGLPGEWERANLNQSFVGADGGCIGVETRLTVGIQAGLWGICP